MPTTSLTLKNLLEDYFSMPFDIESKVIDGETRYICSPSNEGEQFFNVSIYIHNHIRLIVNITPQTHGGYILNEMSLANEEKKKRFFQYKELIKDIGGKITFLVNNKDITSPQQWPTIWRFLECNIIKVPIEESVDNESNILFKWLQHSFDLIFSLLTITDIDDNNQAIQTEGTPYEVKSIRYERNPINRELCLHRKGYSCAICGMNFYDTYGEIGKNYIEVHHTTPVSMMGEGYQLDIDRDMVPLCSNCHSMVHRRKPPFTIDGIKASIKQKLTITINDQTKDILAKESPQNISEFICNAIQAYEKKE